MNSLLADGVVNVFPFPMDALAGFGVVFTGSRCVPRSSCQISRPGLPKSLLAQFSGRWMKSRAFWSPCLRSRCTVFGPNPQTSFRAMRWRKRWMCLPWTAVIPSGFR